MFQLLPYSTTVQFIRFKAIAVFYEIEFITGKNSLNNSGRKYKKDVMSNIFFTCIIYFGVLHFDPLKKRNNYLGIF